MRILLKMTLPLLLWPISAMAQGPPPSGQPDPPRQSSPGAQGLVPSSDPATAADPILVPAQSRPFIYFQPMKKNPLPAGYAPLFNFSAGYAATNVGIPSAGSVPLSGVNFSVSADFGKRFGAKLDLGYARASNVAGTGHPMDETSYLAGPVVYPWRGNLLSTYAHFLAGSARVAGPFSGINGVVELGHVHYPAMAFGGGVEYRLSPAFAFRLGVDYLRTHFYDAAEVVRGQNSFRVVNSIVYYPGMPSNRRRH
jgi:hypothetical protein